MRKRLVDAEDDLKAFLDVMDLLGPEARTFAHSIAIFKEEKFSGVDTFLLVLEPFLASLPKDHT